MLSWINPEYGIPIYELNSCDSAAKKGKAKGYIITVIVIIALIIFGVLWFKSGNRKMVVVVMILIALTILIIPNICGLIGKRQYSGYRARIDNLINNYDMSPRDAITVVRQDEKSGEQSLSTSSIGAAIIGGALLGK